MATPVTSFTSKQRSWSKGGPNGFSVPSRYYTDGKPHRFRSFAEYILASSEDFQLLFTAPPSATPRLLTDSPAPLTRLGTIVDESEGYYYRAEDHKTYEMQRIGFEHF